MESDNKTTATANVRKKPDGSWWFDLTWRGVTYPVSGPFRSQVEAASAAQSAVKKLMAGQA